MKDDLIVLFMGVIIGTIFGLALGLMIAKSPYKVSIEEVFCPAGHEIISNKLYCIDDVGRLVRVTPRKIKK